MLDTCKCELVFVCLFVCLFLTWPSDKARKGLGRVQTDGGNRAHLV